jgi:hypothetical protein
MSDTAALAPPLSLARMSPRHGFLAAIGIVVLASVVAIAFGDSSSRVSSGAPVGGCPVFPANNHWNVRVDRLPVARNSDRLVRKMGANERLFADFTIPYTVVSKSQPRKQVRFRYHDHSDRGPYPIPNDVPIEPGIDEHALIVERGSCRLYELYDLRRRGGQWRAGSGAIFDLRSNRLRPRGWTSADAAGLAILPGLARYGEVEKGAINHAIRFTAAETAARFVYPARHFQDRDPDRSLPPMGLRMRLKPGVDISGFQAQSRVILQALKRYGMLLADEGEEWFISGAPSPGWNFTDLRTLDAIKGSDFEVVDTSSLPKPGLGNGR